MSTPERIVAFFSPREPALSYLFAEIAKRRAFTSIWPSDTMDMLRWAAGRLRFRSVCALPFWPWRNAPAICGPLLQRAARTHDTVIFTKPDQALLLRWFANHRKIYYAFDDYQTYQRDWAKDERDLLAAAHHVIAVSPALGKALQARCPSASGRIFISQNAVPDGWLAEGPPDASPMELPHPIAGVFGRISSRLRLDWLADSVERTPSLHWLFVGDVEKGEMAPVDYAHLARLKRLPNCIFAGPKPYEKLARYARAVDVAVLPYSDRSVNPCASPMRFFMQLPYGQPIVATPGCALLKEYEPFVTMCGSSDALTETLRRLQDQDFDDGMADARRKAALDHTWRVRADRLLDHLDSVH